MKLDYNLIKQILSTMAEYPEHQIPSFTLMEKIKITDENIDLFIGHIKIMGDYSLIQSNDKEGNYGFKYGLNKHLMRVNCDYRMTANGYEFLDVLKNDTVFNKIKDFSFSNALDIGKQLLVNFVSSNFLQ